MARAGLGHAAIVSETEPGGGEVLALSHRAVHQPGAPPADDGSRLGLARDDQHGGERSGTQHRCLS